MLSVHVSSFWFSHISASNCWAGAVTIQEEIILGQLGVYRRELHSWRVTGFEVRTPQILVSDML